MKDGRRPPPSRPPRDVAHGAAGWDEVRRVALPAWDAAWDPDAAGRPRNPAAGAGGGWH
eukprot:gene5245-22479_t